MQAVPTFLIPVVTLVAGLFVLVVGCVTSHLLLAAGGAIGVCYAVARLGGRLRAGGAMAPPVAAEAAPAPPRRTVTRKAAHPSDTGALVEQMLGQGRFPLLLRPQIAQNLSDAQFQQAFEALEKAMALVPDGEVVLGRSDDLAPGEGASAALAGRPHLGEGGRPGGHRGESLSSTGRAVQVRRFFLDRYPVTNAQYYEFVAAGGYEEVALWDETVWPAVLDFVDRTGLPGPRFWREGCYLPGEEDHPVVGVSWYEAAACARWMGKRLPSDAEWVKAGSWPVAISPTACQQRKYPWGDTMDRRRANLWGSGPDKVVPVREFAGGVSVGGVYQLVGNVWEWTSGNFRPGDCVAGELTLPSPMRSIRGGAFDTYFDNQATCHFGSGENPLSRRHNIGFRCAIGVCDLLLIRSVPCQEPPPAAEPAPTTEEVLA